MSIITKILEIFGICQQAQDNIFTKNDHNTVSNEVESVKAVSNTEAAKSDFNSEYPLLIPREKVLKCRYETATRNDQGVMEDFFFDYLSRAFPNISNNAISIHSDAFSLTPDLTIIDEVNNIFIALEIDEPYSVGKGGTLIPIHTIGSDDARNKHFSTLGWTVIRFAEEQVSRHPEVCIKIIEHYISTGEILKTKPVKCWTNTEAQSMIDSAYRNTYLPFPFKDIITDDPKSYAAYRSFEISSIRKQTKEGEKYIIINLKYPRTITATGEILAIGNHPQQCWVSEKSFWRCVYKSKFGEMIRDYDLEESSIGFYINTKSGSKMLEGYGKAQGKYFNIFDSKFDLVFSDLLIMDIKQSCLDIINPIRVKRGLPKFT